MGKRILLILLPLTLAAAACGGTDDTATTVAPTAATTIAPTAATTGISTASTTTAEAPSTTANESTTTNGGTTLPACDALVGLDEAAALFGEPAVFDAEESETPPGLAATQCVWTSVEDPDDLEDLQVQLLQVQIYRGAQFYAPEMTYEDFEHLDGIGDDAFVTDGEIVTAGFLAGDLVAFVGFSVIFPQDAPEAITKRDQVVDLLRLVYDRIT
jgi:hypothetical protein